MYDLQNYWAQQNAQISAMAPVPQIVVSVATETAISAKIEVNYLTYNACLLYTSDAADERSSVDLGGRRIIKKNNTDELADRLSTRNNTTTQ